MQKSRIQPNPSNNASENALEVVESFLEAMRVKDLERALALLHEDVEYQNVPFSPYRGRARVERTLRIVSRIPGDVGIRLHHIAERGGVVLTERTDSVRGPWMDLEFWVCGTFEVRGGKIVLWRDYFDLATFTLQLLTSPIRRLLRARTPEPVAG